MMRSRLSKESPRPDIASRDSSQLKDADVLELATRACGVVAVDRD